MTRLILLALLGVLVLPAAALAAPAKISPRAASVSAAGVATVEVANPNRYALRGTAKVTVRGRTVAKRTVRLPKRSVTGVSSASSRRASPRCATPRAAPRSSCALRRPGGRRSSARRTLTLRVPESAPVPAPGSDGGQPAPAGATRWAGRMGTEGAYDDFEFTVEQTGRCRSRSPAPVPVTCFENGGSYRSALSFEIFDAPGPWTIGTDGLVAKQGISGNQLVYRGMRTINYKVTGTTQQPGKVSGNARDVVLRLPLRRLHQHHHVHQLRRLAVLRGGAG